MFLVDRLTVLYKNGAGLKDVSLCAESGSCVGLMGVSGAGKSTLAKALCGILPIISGSATLDGAVLAPKTHTIGYVDQSCSLYPWLTVEKNILLGIKVKRKNLDKNLWDSVERVLGIKQLLRRYPGELSGGERQRTALYRSFILKPDLLVLDEAFSSLDEEAARIAGNLLTELRLLYKPTVLFISHKTSEVMRVSDSVFVLENGCLNRKNSLVANNV